MPSHWPAPAVQPQQGRLQREAPQRGAGRRSCLQGDHGTVMMLVIGLVPIIAGMIAVGTDAAVMFTHRRALAADAESAVLAAAQSADLAALYTSGRLTSLPLDCRTARAVVDKRLINRDRSKSVGAVQVVDFRCSRTSVSMRVRSQVELPFAHHFGIDPTVDVGTDAAASSPLR